MEENKKENKVWLYVKKNYKNFIILALSVICVVGFSGLSYATIKVYQKNQQLNDIIDDLVNPDEDQNNAAE